MPLRKSFGWAIGIPDLIDDKPTKALNGLPENFGVYRRRR
ncbi:hypothetical protein ACVI1I_006276 [Bradyrhizobium sp. USDA 4459]